VFGRRLRRAHPAVFRRLALWVRGIDLCRWRDRGPHGTSRPCKGRLS